MKTSSTFTIGLRLVLLLSPVLGCAQNDEPTAPADVTPSALTGTASASPTVLYQTSQATVVQDGDWVRWQFATPLSSVTTTATYRGARTADGGCQFNGAESATITSSPSLVTLERGIGTNINQCLMEVERAQVPTTAALDAGAMSGASGHSPTVSAGAEGGPVLQLEDSYFHNGYYSQYMTDPIGIHVTTLTSHVDWDNNGACIGAWHRYYGTDYYWQSSWSLDYSSDSGTQGGTGPCNKITETSYADFLNYAFCALTPTVVSSSVTFNAYPYNSSGTWSASVNGLCYWMLSYHNAYQPW